MAPKKPPRKRPRANEVSRPSQPVPLGKWQAANDVAQYEYEWEGVGTVVVVRQAVTEDGKYSYVHVAATDAKMDHWVATDDLRARPAEGQPKSVHRAMVRTVDHIVFGDLIIPAWYASPFPSSLSNDLRANGGRLYVCEVCLKYTTSPHNLSRHRGENGSCSGCGPLKGVNHPPGNQIYTHQNWSVWDVDGGPAEGGHGEGDWMVWEHSSVLMHPDIPPDSLAAREVVARMRFCDSLSLLSRMFLDTKLNRYGTNPFRFFVLTEEKGGKHMVRGMFSREKGHLRNNLSCITVLPPWQRSGWGKRLVHISYLLSRIEGVSGMPEKPLSLLGKRVYEGYQKGQVLDYLNSRVALCGSRDNSRLVSEIVAATSIDRDDVTQILKKLCLSAGPNSNDIDLSQVNPKLDASIPRPELQVDQSALFHLNTADMSSMPVTEI